jgi:hypothetical protein
MNRSKTFTMTGFETGREADDIAKIRSDAALAALLDEAALYSSLIGAMLALMVAEVQGVGAVESDGVDSVGEQLFCALWLYPEVRRRAEVLYGE